MAAIASIDAASSVGAFSVTETTLTSDDTITYDSTKQQILVLRNPTAGPLTATIDGSTGSTISVDGLGSVSVASGLAVAVPANSVKAVRLNSVRHYCQGVVHLTGGTGLLATLYSL